MVVSLPGDVSAASGPIAILVAIAGVVIVGIGTSGSVPVVVAVVMIAAIVVVVTIVLVDAALVAVVVAAVVVGVGGIAVGGVVAGVGRRGRFVGLAGGVVVRCEQIARRFGIVISAVGHTASVGTRTVVNRAARRGASRRYQRVQARCSPRRRRVHVRRAP